jgi:hypothetical protein
MPCSVMHSVSPLGHTNRTVKHLAGYEVPVVTVAPEGSWNNEGLGEAEKLWISKLVESVATLTYPRMPWAGYGVPAMRYRETAGRANVCANGRRSTHGRR